MISCKCSCTSSPLASRGAAMGSGIKARPNSLLTSVSIWSVVAASVSGFSTASCSRKNCR